MKGEWKQGEEKQLRGRERGGVKRILRFYSFGEQGEGARGRKEKMSKLCLKELLGQGQVSVREAEHGGLCFGRSLGFLRSERKVFQVESGKGGRTGKGPGLN